MKIRLEKKEIRIGKTEGILMFSGLDLEKNQIFNYIMREPEIISKLRNVLENHEEIELEIYGKKVEFRGKTFFEILNYFPCLKKKYFLGYMELDDLIKNKEKINEFY
ncbi:MAG: hypothetical protein ACRCU3_01835 [Eubacteriaceae bacterium]